MSKNQKNSTRQPTNPHADLPKEARLAAIDYLTELRRQNEGVRQVGINRDPIPDPFQVPEWRDTGVTTRTTKIKYKPGEAPAKAYIRSLGIEGLLASEVADEVGCSVNLVRKLQKDPDIKAPSLEVGYGKNKIYVYLPADVEEIRTYWNDRRTLRPRE